MHNRQNCVPVIATACPAHLLLHYVTLGEYGKTPLTRPAKWFTAARHTPSTVYRANKQTIDCRTEPGPLSIRRSVLATLSSTSHGRSPQEALSEEAGKREREQPSDKSGMS